MTEEQTKFLYSIADNMGTTGIEDFTCKDGEKMREIIKALEQQPTSEDCISRQETLDAIIKELGIRNESYLLECERPIYNAVKDMPPVIPTQRWIPCSERLPEDRNIVLVTAYWHETYQVMMASYFGDGLWWCVPFNNCGDHMMKLNPKAWQPLPKPYEEK